MLTHRNFDFLKVLACPVCGGKLNQVNALLVCKRGHSFHSIDGIPLFYARVKDLEQFEMHERVKLDEPYMTSYLSEQIPLLSEDMLPVRNAIRDSLMLDLGSGMLFPSAVIKKLFGPREIISIDFSYHLIKAGGDLVLKILNISDKGIFRVVSDLNLNKLPFANSTFDSVIGRHVIHHIRDPSALLAEVKRVLKPGGICWFLEPCEAYFPLFKWDSPFKVIFHKVLSSFKGHHVPIPKDIETEAQCLRKFDLPYHYHGWRELFSRFFKVRYFGYPPSTEYLAKDFQVIGRTPVSLRKLVIFMQFYVRVLFENPSILIIGENS